jgi:dipeptidyl aminopeptidase/acylaminoacyl peptidase
MRSPVEEQLHFTNEQGESLAGTLHVPARPGGGGIVLGHCFTCTRHTSILRRIAQALTAEGFVVLRFDFSGNGQSEGDFADSTYSKQIDEMIKGAELVAEQGVKWIGAAGHSMGGLISFLTAVRSDRIKAACVLASRLSGMNPTQFLSRTQRDILAKTGEVTFSSRGRFLKLTRAFFSDADRFDPTAALKSFQKPLLVVHGDRDDIVPVDAARKAKELSGGRLTLEIVPGADHMFSREEDRRKISRTVVDWFTRQLEPM